MKDVYDLAPSVISSHWWSAFLLQVALLQTTVCPSLARVANLFCSLRQDTI